MVMTVWQQAFPAIASLQCEHKHYLDSAATTQLPSAVIEAMHNYMAAPMANVHRAQNALANACTQAFEDARTTLSRWFGLGHEDALIWTRGTTEAINLVAFGWAANQLKAGDEIIVSTAEHHANLIPWQQLCQKGIVLKCYPIPPDGRIDLNALEALISPQTRLMALHFASNVMGVLQPISDIATFAKAHNIKLLIDAAQVGAHMRFSFTELAVDFLAISAHKMYGPTGIGALLAKAERLDEMQPIMFGGEMVAEVSLTHAVYAPPPIRFEAGTPNIIGVIGWQAAVKWLASQNLAALHTHEAQLTRTLMTGLQAIDSVHIIGDPNAERVPLVSFVVNNIHPYDLAALLDEQGVFVRAGQHCAHPLYAQLKLPGSVRISIGAYNTEDDIHACLEAIAYALELLQ